MSRKYNHLKPTIPDTISDTILDTNFDTNNQPQYSLIWTYMITFENSL